MANGTLLSLFQNTLQGMGVQGYGQPSSVVGNTTQDIVQTLALINSGGDELAREHNWEAGSIQYNFTATFFAYTGQAASGATSLTGMSSIASLDNTFMVTGTGIDTDTFVVSAVGTTVTISRATTAAAAAGTTFTFSKCLFPFPSDFDRPIDRTQWDKSKHWEMLGPMTAQQWEWLKSGWIATGPRVRFRPLGGYFAIWPPLGVTDSLSYEYQSKYWVVATGGTAPTKQAFAVDTDTCIYPDALTRSLIKLKYLEAKGLDTTAAYRDFMAQRDLAKASDAGRQTLNMAPRAAEVLIGWDNIPDSNYGR